ncbi:hypothetical protein N9I32_01620 [Porticoccaceae bacterium]|nr:hypothetical protein [Porticoccaceae bacterium]
MLIKYFKALARILIRFYYTIKKSGFVKLNNPKSEFIIWVPDFFSVRFFYDDNFQKVFSTYYYLRENCKVVTIYTRRDIGRFFDKKVIYFGSKNYNLFGFKNYMMQMAHISEQLESQGNEVFPSTKEVVLWENKDVMHSIFNEKDIRTPKTELVDLETYIPAEFPFLIKELNSCSSLGLYKIESKDDYDKAKHNLLSTKERKVLVQELLDIKSDLRVIYVGNEIILHYWRINKASEWRPTSTGHGSEVDFVTFPSDWKDWMDNVVKNLDIRTGAFDITWENDNLDGEPFVLEVSPFYQPNPPPGKSVKTSYGEWKKSVNIFPSGYQASFVRIVFDIQRKFVETIIKQ